LGSCIWKAVFFIADFDTHRVTYNSYSAYDAFEHNFSYTLDRLKSNSTKVVIVHQIPNLNMNPLDSLAKSIALGVSTDRVPKRNDLNSNIDLER